MVQILACHILAISTYTTRHHAAVTENYVAFLAPPFYVSWEVKSKGCTFQDSPRTHSTRPLKRSECKLLVRDYSRETGRWDNEGGE